MRATAWLGLMVTYALASALGACGSDEENRGTTEDGGGGSTGSGGGENTGGSAETGGSPGSGGTPAPTCDTTACPPLNIAGTTIAACCVDEDTCGYDGTVLNLGCIDPATFPDAAPPFEGGSPFPPVDVLDGGIIPVGDGGAPIVLDDSCSGVNVTLTLPIPLPVRSLPPLPGCCMPNGKCGGSSHTLVEVLGPTTPLACASNADVEEYFLVTLTPFGGGADVSTWFSVSEDPNQDCAYRIPGSGDGGMPPSGDAATDASSDGGGTPNDASAGDGALPDGGRADASTGDAASE